MPQIVYKIPKLDSQLTRKCPELKEEYTGVLEEDMRVDGENMKRAGVCRARQHALVDALEELADDELETD